MLGERLVPELHDITASGQQVVVLAGGSLRRGDTTLIVKIVSVYPVRDGRITACWLHVVGGQDAFDRFWS